MSDRAVLQSLGQGLRERAQLVAIVVYFRTPTLLAACLDALRCQSSPPEEIIVVDNSSSLDGSLTRPAPGDDWRWLRADRNLGFGAACNLGARDVASQYLLFVNADLTVDDQACERLISAAETDTAVGVVGPRIYGSDDAVEWSARAFPTIATGLLGRSSVLTGALICLGRPPAGVSPALGPSRRVDWVSGACMLVRRRAFEEVSGFDEDYWMYWEDADLCRRLRARGWYTMLSTDATARHTTGSSGRSDRTIEAFHESAARYYERHVAQTALSAALARAVLTARMRLSRRRHARRDA